MPIRARLAQAAVKGAILGAIALSLLMLLHWRILDPDLFDNEMWPLILVFSVPAGAWLGMAAGVARVLLRVGDARSAGVAYLFAGGALLALLLYMMLLGGGIQALSIFAVPLCAAVVFVLYGWRLLR